MPLRDQMVFQSFLELVGALIACTKVWLCFAGLQTKQRVHHYPESLAWHHKGLLENDMGSQYPGHHLTAWGKQKRFISNDILQMGNDGPGTLKAFSCGQNTSLHFIRKIIFGTISLSYLTHHSITLHLFQLSLRLPGSGSTFPACYCPAS